MLPPRLIRSLWPCHRRCQQSSPQIIPWATYNARRKLSSARGLDHRANHHADGKLPSTDSTSTAQSPTSSSNTHAQLTETLICKTCRHTFDSPAAVRAHRLFSDACAGQIQHGGYICRRCFIPFPRREHAQAHARANPECAGKIHSVATRSDPAVLGSDSSALWTANVIQCAESKHRQVIHSLLGTVLEISEGNSPHLKFIVDKINRTLRRVLYNAKKERDGPVIRMIKKEWPSTSSAYPHGSRQRRQYGIQSNDVEPSRNLGNVRVRKYIAKAQRDHPHQASPRGIASRPHTSETTSSVSPRDIKYTPAGSSPEIEAQPIREDKNNGLKRKLDLLTEQVKLLSERFEGFQSAYRAISPQFSNPKAVQPTVTSGTVPGRADSGDSKPKMRKNKASLIYYHYSGERLMRSPHLSQEPDITEDVASAHPDTSSTSNATSTVSESSSASEKVAVSNETSEQSLLGELFPEAYTWAQPYYSPRNPYPKLNLPSETPLIRRTETDAVKTDRERFVESFQSRTEQLTALQLVHSSTELTESDFRRIIPKGKHIESWASEGEFIKVIPGRDPISLERLPFYYIVFRTPEAALAYQNNASRLHKLCQLHQPSSLLSAIPPPKGFLEDGEDLGLVTSSYLLKPAGVPLNLNMIMKPYNPALRNLIEQGGYTPIVQPMTHTNTKNNTPVFKVLFKIEGHEPLPTDIYKILRTDAYGRGLTWPFRNQEKGIHRLRDIVDLKAKIQAVSADNPRAWNGTTSTSTRDSGLDFLSGSLAADYHINANHNNHNHHAAGGGASNAEHQQQHQQQQLNQILMNRVYNRWLIEFDDEQAARRFARLWNMRPFPIDTSPAHWMGEGLKMCETEFLW